MLHDLRRGIHFGVNYVPRRNWYYSWNDWDAKSVEDDFRAIARIGATHVRVQLIWPYFQPNPAFVSPAHLQRLAELMDMARDQGLDVLVSVLTGFLSGYFFMPSKIQPKDVFVSSDAIAGEKIFFDAVGEAIGDRPNLIGFDLGNEVNCLNHALDTATGDAWARDLTAHVRRNHPGLWIVNGVDHNPWFCGSTFSCAHLARDYDAVTLHCWPEFTGALTKGRLDEPPSTELLAFMTRFARAFAADPAKPIWLQEFGCSDLWGTPEEKAVFLNTSVERAIAAGARLFTWWCSHDIDPKLRFSPLEYDLGLLDQGNNEKPLARGFRELAQKYAGQNPLPVPTDALAAMPEDFRPQADHGHLAAERWTEFVLSSTTWNIYRDYLRVREEGKEPAVTGAQGS